LTIKQSSFTYTKRGPFCAIIGKYLSVKTLFSFLNPPMSVLSVALCLVPFLILWLKKLGRVNVYLFIGIYWLANALCNLPDCLGESENSTLQLKIILLYNVLDAPLLLLIFYFASTGLKKRILFYLFLFFLIFEPAVIAWKGYNLTSSTIIVGVDGAVALIFSIWGMAEYFQKIEHNPFESAMGFAYAGFIFVYGFNIVTFVFSYLKRHTEGREANLFLYYFSLILAAFLTSMGMWRYAKPRLKHA